MSRGNYSPTVYGTKTSGPFVFNSHGKVPTEWSKEVADSGVEFSCEHMFVNYDSEGFDPYGYSAFDADGKYVGIGSSGVDRNGISEYEYMCMTEEEFDQF